MKISTGLRCGLALVNAFHGYFLDVMWGELADTGSRTDK